MCLGRTHAVGGFVLGAGAADICAAVHQMPFIPIAMACGTMAAGAALLNDLDTSSSTASNSAGRISQALSVAVQKICLIAFRLTSTPEDVRYGSPVHRGLTHTLLFSAFVGATVGVLAAWGFWAIFFIALVCMAPLVRIVAPSVRGVPSVLLPIVVAGFVAYLNPAPLAMGGAIGLGILSHAILDGCTVMGVPLFWPLRLRGMRWRRVGIPRSLRIETGGRAEPWVARALSMGAVVLLPPVLALAKNLGVYI